jgi:hypothetical protein
MGRFVWRVDVDHWLFLRRMRILPLLAHIVASRR